MRRVLLLFVGVLALASVAVAAPGGATRTQTPWVITDLGTLGGTYSEAVAINEPGQVIGNSQTTKGFGHAFIWESGRIRDLGTLGGHVTTALAVNGRGQVVGWSDTRAGKEHAFLWTQGKMRDLGTLGGTRSDALAINERQQVVGWAETKSGAVHAFLWQKGRMRDLGTLGGRQSEALAINEHGQIVGRCDSSKVPDTGREGQWKGRACLWQAGKVVNLDPAPLEGTEGRMDRVSRAVAVNERVQVVVNIDTGDGYTGGFLWQKGRRTPRRELENGNLFWADAINARGEAVGSSQNEDLAYRPVMWRGNSAIDLGALPGAESEEGHARAINDRSQITGRSGPHAFLWEKGVMTDLGKLPGYPFSDAVAINEHNQIVGWSSRTAYPDPEVPTRTHAVLWTLKR